MSKSNNTNLFKELIAESREQITRIEHRVKAIELLALTMENDTVAEEIYNLATEIKEIIKSRRYYG